MELINRDHEFRGIACRNCNTRIKMSKKEFEIMKEFARLFGTIISIGDMLDGLDKKANCCSSPDWLFAEP